MIAGLPTIQRNGANKAKQVRDVILNAKNHLNSTGQQTALHYFSFIELLCYSVRSSEEESQESILVVGTKGTNNRVDVPV